MKKIDDSIRDFIAKQPADRQALLSDLHKAIVDEDASVVADVEPMMGQEMIIYKAVTMKYGLASPNNYMSLHVLPIYISRELHTKYEPLLPRASFQKGCINFKSANDMPISVVRQLIADCSKMDLIKIREEQLQQRKQKAKSK